MSDHSDIIVRLERLAVAVEHVHHMAHASGVKLNQILVRLSVLDSKLETLMALVDDLKVSIKQLDDETTAIGALITKLAAGIKNSMTDAEVADVKAAFGTLSDRLTTLAVDPTIPVPPPPPMFAALKAKK